MGFSEAGDSCNWHVLGNSVYELLQGLVVPAGLKALDSGPPSQVLQVSLSLHWLPCGERCLLGSKRDWWADGCLDPCKHSDWAGISSTKACGSCPISFSVDWHLVSPMVAFWVWKFGAWWQLYTKPLLFNC